MRGVIENIANRDGIDLNIEFARLFICILLCGDNNNNAIETTQHITYIDKAINNSQYLFDLGNKTDVLESNCDVRVRLLVELKWIAGCLPFEHKVDDLTKHLASDLC